MSNVYAVIMAGGAGTRFWPASRAKTPKQFLPLGADAKEPLLAATVRRLEPLIPPERVYIATGAALVEATSRAAPQVPRAQVLAEPVPRNTAPCVGWATMSLLRRDADAIVVVLPSDHFIRNEPEFLRVVERALGVARDGYLCTIGVVPTRPDTGYGYIEVGETLSRGAFMVSRFVEKPDRVRAEEFVRDGKHLWNAGMFFFEARTMARAIETHLPDLWSGLEEIDAAARRGEEQRALDRLFPTFQSISIDHGVMEKAGAVSVVPGDFGWNDVGSWESAWELAAKDDTGNSLPKDAVAIDARGNFVCDRTSNIGKRVYSLVGVSDLILVETDDAVLLIPRDRAQDVRAVVERLKVRGDTGRL